MNIKQAQPHIYLEATESLCPQCLRRLPAKIVLRDKSVYIDRTCPEHGFFSGILEEDAAWHANKSGYDKPGTKVPNQMSVSKGCPFDCGLCPEHDQHSCIGLIEVCTACDLGCPLCFASAETATAGSYQSLSEIDRMLDFFIASEGGSAEILQISGGEPTLHPEILEIIQLARSKHIGYVMLNTNGLRLAQDLDFVKALGEFRGGFEIYLQFDGLDDKVYRELRGQDMLEIKHRAIANCAANKVPITLVTTVRAGLNDRQLAGIIDFGLKTKGIRGCNFQPEAWFGRGYQKTAKQRITLSGVLRRIAESCHGMISMDDFVPLPCNVQRVALSYLYRSGAGFVPLTRGLKIRESLNLINNTFLFSLEDTLKNSARELLKPESCCGAISFLKDFLHIVPASFFLKSREDKMEYIDTNTFRISVSSFVDAHNFDIKSMQKECVHVITPELRKIPFSAYNLLHRKVPT